MEDARETSNESNARKAEESVKVQQWWTQHVIAPMMNSHRLNFTMIEHQLRSYDQFVFKYVPEIIQESSKIMLWLGCLPDGKLHLQVLPQDKKHYATHFIKFQFTPVQYRPSPFTVRQCHLQDETYKFDVRSHVHVTIMDLQQKKFLMHRHVLFSDVLLCSIPIMVQSKICNTHGIDVPPTEILDPGGYFILEGKEKVIIAQEDHKNNYPFVMRTTSTTHNRYNWKCEIRSNNLPKIRSTSTTYILLKKQTNDIDVELPFYGTFIPVLVIFRMMDVDNRDDILRMLCNHSNDPALVAIMTRIVDHESKANSKQELAQIFVPMSSTVEKVNEHAAMVAKAIVDKKHSVDLQDKTKVPPPTKSLFQNSLTNEFFPHIGTQWTPEINLRKLQFLSFCVRKLVLVVLNQESSETRHKTSEASGQKDSVSGVRGDVGETKKKESNTNQIYTGRQKHMPDSRDILHNKYIKCTGFSLGLMFRQFFREFTGSIFKKFRLNFKKQLEAAHGDARNIECIKQYILHTKQLRLIFEHDKVTKQLVYIIGSGNWVANKQRHRIVTITSKSKFMNNESKTPGQVNTATSVVDQSGSNNPNSRAGSEYRQTYATDQTGVAQSLTRHFPMTVLSHLRRVNKNINRKGKSVAPRLLNESQWGIYCGVSTPEGKACGLLSQLALLCHIRHVSLSTTDLIFQVLDALHGVVLVESEIKIQLFVNYVPLLQVGASQIMEVIDVLRYKADLPFDASVFINDTDDIVPQIHVCYDEGACLRPLLSLHHSADLLRVVQTTPLPDVWPELVKRNIIQYKTKEEEFCGLYSVAPNLWASQPEHTHVELYDPSLFSPEILIIPFMNHNQSPRNMFAMNLLRQSVADVGYNYFNRFDPHNHRLWYPQVPLVQTTQDRDWNLSEIPSGINCVVQMMCMPYNMEDAIIINRASVDRGLFRSDVLETFVSTDDGVGGGEKGTGVEFGKPDFHSVTNLQNANYQTIDQDGLPFIGRSIQKRDVIIGRVSYHDSKSVKQAQAHAYQSCLSELPSSQSQISSSTRIASSIPSSTHIPSTTRIPSSIHIPSSARIASSTKISSVKSIVSDRSEHDMKTLRDHLLFIHENNREHEPNERAKLAILENLSSSISPSCATSNIKQFQKDHSVVMQKELFPTQKMVVDQCLVTQNSRDSDARTVKVRLRQSRVPEVGDKLSSRHGQKGVIGRIMHPDDMPYTVDGQVADLIINPHCMPSRMTIGQLLESLSGKALALDDSNNATIGVGVVNVNPCDVDSGAYFGCDMSSCQHKTLPKIQAYANILAKNGFDMNGNEQMFDGTTGRPLTNGRSNEGIFMGVVYYHRLRHMVADKIYARAKGSVQLTTRQPNEGRSAEGGLRLGEMERDVFISHGATQVLRDRFLDNSDRYETLLCNRCGGYANAMSRTCSVCRDKADLHKVVTPYALKLLQQELASGHMYLEFSSQKSSQSESVFSHTKEE